MKMADKVNELKHRLYEEKLKCLDKDIEIAILYREMFYKQGYMGFLLDLKNKDKL